MIYFNSRGRKSPEHEVIIDATDKKRARRRSRITRTRVGLGNI